ncbi:MAG: hypothetical protein HOP30_07240 [Cyclobacteriaceae bacterium]|nr:hypothetical protein [Cyclobacteriaceae bacterium]
MRHFSFLFILFFGYSSFAQSVEESELMARLNFSTTIPTELLTTRSVVLFQSAIPQKDLDECQSFFQQSGIDAVAYFDIHRMLAGHDVRRTYASYLANRGIKFLILFQKDEKGYRLIFCSFNGKKDLVDINSAAWKQENVSLNELLRTVYRFAVSNLKKQNFLINDLPEMDITINPFTGRINESFSIEVKSFKTAIPKFGNPVDDAELEAYLKANFPLKYELVDADATEESLYAKGFRTILRFVHARGIVAKEILGYDVTQVARSLPSAVFVNNEIQIKTVPSSEVIYKFYFKNIEYGNVFLGNKWDADLTWQDALRNHIQAYKINQKIN